MSLDSAIILAPVSQIQRNIDLLSGPTTALSTLLNTAWTGTSLSDWLAISQNRNDWDQLWNMPNAAAAMASNPDIMAAVVSTPSTVNTLYSSVTAWAAIWGSKVARDAWNAKASPYIPVETPWVRPSDWLAIPTLTDADNMFVGLLGITDDDANFIALSAAGDYTVDWGDGLVENIASGVQANHQYTYANISDSTISTRGYRQVIVTVTPQLGQTFTSINLQKKHSQPNLPTFYNVKWLDIAVAGAALTTLVVSQPSAVLTLRDIECATLNISAVTNMSNMFAGCMSLQSVPLFNTAAVTNMSYMFASCYLLQSVPLFNTAVVTNMTNMFNGCNSLHSVPLFDTAAVTNMTGMFQGCTLLQSVPLFNTAVVTNMSYMFTNCPALPSVPAFNTAVVTNMTYMFQYCYSLQSGPLFTTTAVTNMSYMFYGCSSLQSVPLLNTAAVTTMYNMFYGCSSLQSVPLFNTAVVTNMTYMFQSCSLLRSVPAFNMAAVTTMSSMFQFCNSLTTSSVIGMKVSITYTGCKLSTASINGIFARLGKANGAQSITITGNWGADAAVSRAATTTSGSNTVTMADTSTLVVGELATATGVSTGVAVTLQDAGDTVTRAAHGLADGTAVSFSAITTTTGIITYTTYYVLNATADTFQLAATVGGAAIALTTNGTGTLLYGNYITAIVANTNITLSAPASASGAVTLTFRTLDTSIATLKGWTVIG